MADERLQWPNLRLMMCGEAVERGDKITLNDAGLVVLATTQPERAAILTGEALGRGKPGRQIEVYFGTAE